MRRWGSKSSRSETDGSADDELFLLSLFDISLESAGSNIREVFLPLVCSSPRPPLFVVLLVCSVRNPREFRERVQQCISTARGVFTETTQTGETYSSSFVSDMCETSGVI